MGKVPSANEKGPFSHFKRKSDYQGNEVYIIWSENLLDAVYKNDVNNVNGEYNLHGIISYSCSINITWLCVESSWTFYHTGAFVFVFITNQSTKFLK